MAAQQPPALVWHFSWGRLKRVVFSRRVVNIRGEMGGQANQSGLRLIRRKLCVLSYPRAHPGGGGPSRRGGGAVLAAPPFLRARIGLYTLVRFFCFVLQLGQNINQLRNGRQAKQEFFFPGFVRDGHICMHACLHHFPFLVLFCFFSRFFAEDTRTSKN